VLDEFDSAAELGSPSPRRNSNLPPALDLDPAALVVDALWNHKADLPRRKRARYFLA